VLCTFIVGREHATAFLQCFARASLMRVPGRVTLREATNYNRPPGPRSAATYRDAPVDILQAAPGANRAPRAWVGVIWMGMGGMYWAFNAPVTAPRSLLDFVLVVSYLGLRPGHRRLW